MLVDAGFDEASGTAFTDRMADGLIIAGSEKEVGDRIRGMSEFAVYEMLGAIVGDPLGERDGDAAEHGAAAPRAGRQPGPDRAVATADVAGAEHFSGARRARGPPARTPRARVPPRATAE